MMERSGNVIRSVAWTELFPWLIIFKTFRLAIGFRALVMSALAVALTALGCWVFGFGVTFENTVGGMPSHPGCPWTEITNLVPDKPDLLGETLGSDKKEESASKPAFKDPEEGRRYFEQLQKQHARQIVEPISSSWSMLSRPLFSGLGYDVTFGQTLRLIGCALWSLAVWAFFGAAITRIAAVHLAANERITLGAALRFACSKFFAYFFAPLGPLVLIGLSALFVLCFAWLMRWDAGIFFVSLVWPLFLISGLTIALLLVGLVFGWPLMWPTISTEGTDGFDALSRSYAGVYQRPLQYLFYTLVAMGLGWLGWIFVKNFASTVVWTTYWSASWSAGAETIRKIVELKTETGEPLTGMALYGARIIHFFAGVTKLLAVGFCFSYFWNASSAIYLLLRRSVDATEMDEVYLDADESEAKFGLPKILIDDAGAPEMEEKKPAAVSAKSEAGEGEEKPAI
jgi:hypothetical protein